MTYKNGAIFIGLFPGFISKSRLPPGPPPLPLLGNLLQVPRSNYQQYYSKWKGLYGGIAYFRVFGRHFAIINDPEIVTELFDKRSAIYSTRPVLVFDKDDYLVDLAEKLAKLTTEATEPGRWLVDAFPILQYLPPWFPGAGFITWAEDAKLKCQSFTRAPLNYVKEAMATEDFTPSFTSEHLSRIPDNDTDGEDILMYAAASMYSGGTDTIVSVMKLFFLMMARHPDIQKRAQDEVDTIIGENRIPNATDRPFLPYINCIIKELLRFNPVVPLVVHSPEKDDFFSGYLIPKGTWIMANVWHMTHDPQAYPYPDEFIPERFEDHTHNPTGKVQPDPSNLVFGFGRRICPGRQFSEVSLFLAITCTLWAFSINPKVDAEGNISPLNIEFTTGHTVHPKPFECSVVPRPGNRILLIKQVLE
ncbi:cytochrome P450 [Pyrrhoderma noxium]|uniref:Cytochrome P450 n=1 Tax=Pyrrhoderma noxium TaxID=2282107 RepID=A0A286UIY0_9AGAM|nr:cytochrome P450 [Pyrrhoderma noxium]